MIKRTECVLALTLLLVLIVPLAQADTAKANEEVCKGEIFEIKISEALHPSYDWRCTRFDEGYVELLGETHEPPESGMLGVTTKVFTFRALQGILRPDYRDRTGVTTKVFTFRALQEGTTAITFTYYQLDAARLEGNPLEALEDRTYEIVILPVPGR